MEQGHTAKASNITVAAGPVICNHCWNSNHGGNDGILSGSISLVSDAVHVFLYVASTGLAGNRIVMFLLEHHARHSINIQSAFVHIIRADCEDFVMQ